MATDGSAHRPPYLVLVQVSKSCFGLESKLQKYFPIPKKSGGGEYTAKAGPTEGTFWVEFLEREVENPNHLDEMKDQNLLLVDLPPGHQEHKQVKDKFCQTYANFTIKKIQRIQNRSLWNLNETKITLMDNQNKHTNNKRSFFHGTSIDSVSHVNSQGFNHSYAGENVLAWGKGAYFAVSALYLANSTCSKPDLNWKEYICYMPVLTVDYILGNPSFMVLPPKGNQDANVLYDSVTENEENSSLFFIFYDHQSNPESLITFRK